jgi:hypothetical protein
MRLRARRYADMEQSQFVTDSEVNDYLNDSLADLYDQLVAAYGEDYYMASQVVTTLANVSTYTLPTAFYKLSGVVRVDQSVTPERNMGTLDRWERLETFQVSNSLNFNYPRYRIVANTIQFSPTPAAGLTIRLFYIPVSPVLVIDSDTFNGINGFEDWAVLDAAIKMGDKEEMDVSALRARKDRLERRIMDMGANRDANESARVTDVSGWGAPWWNRLPPP